MRRIHDRVAGLDVHRDSVAACVELYDGTSVEVDKESFSTTAAGVRALGVARQVLAHIDFLDATIDTLSAEIVERLVPFQAAVSLLVTIPGVSDRPRPRGPPPRR